MVTDNSKVHKPHSYTKSNLKDKYAITSYGDISSNVSSEFDTNFQSDEKTSQEFL